MTVVLISAAIIALAVFMVYRWLRRERDAFDAFMSARSRRKKQAGFASTDLMLVLVYGALICVPLAAWVTHVIATIHAAQWVLLVVGALFAPIGVIHGFGLWFGLF